VDDGIEALGPFWRFLFRQEQLLRSLPTSGTVYVAETKRHFTDAGRMFSRIFPKLDATIFRDLCISWESSSPRLRFPSNMPCETAGDTPGLSPCLRAS
jgi:hypothetical protein